MASIDWGMIGLGALIGVGCREQLKAAGRVAAVTAANLASVAATAAQQVAQETKETEKSPEAAAADEVLQRIDQHIAEQFAGIGNGQAGQGKKGH